MPFIGRGRTPFESLGIDTSANSNEDSDEGVRTDLPDLHPIDEGADGLRSASTLVWEEGLGCVPTHAFLVSLDG